MRSPMPVFALAMVLSTAAMPWPGLAQPAGPASGHPVLEAHVAQGTLTGIATGAQPKGPTHTQVSAFLGIPYAQPPIGPLRWQAPQVARPWQGVLRADHFGANCEQTPPPLPGPDGKGAGPPWTSEYDIRGPISEDCLTLNVWTPAAHPGRHLPVLVWIYGGGYTAGGTTVPIYDGAPLASQGLLVVTVNYRVGLFGFMASPELSEASPTHSSGNYGLLDQIAALRWVRDNIAAFGGDPARVTIAGQSAGASSVDHLIATPLAHGLFAQAISQSGSAMGMPIPDKAPAEARGLQLEHLAGVQSIDALRKIPPAALMAAAAHISHAMLEPLFSPSIDGFVLPDASYIDADTNDTPLLTGMTANETTGAQPHYGEATTASLQAEIHHTFGARASQFSRLYRVEDRAEPNSVRAAIGRDRGLAALALWADRRAGRSRSPSYLYLWAHGEPGPEASRYRAFHASELSYVFDTLDTARRPFIKEDRQLAQMASTYWANFVKTGNPNGAGLAPWPAYEPEGRRLMKLDVPAETMPILPADKLQFYRDFKASGGDLGLFYLYSGE